MRKYGLFICITEKKCGGLCSNNNPPALIASSTKDFKIKTFLVLIFNYLQRCLRYLPYQPLENGIKILLLQSF